MKKILLFFTFLAFFASYLPGQTLFLEENFDYPLGDTLLFHGWIVQSDSGVNPITVTSGLTYSGYPSSNIGNAALVDANGEDLSLALSSLQNTGSLYFSFLIKVDGARTSLVYPVHMVAGGGPGFAGRIFTRDDGFGTSFEFGVSKYSDAPTTTGFIYSYGVTYLVVLKYTFVADVNNDEVALFVFTGSIPATEPAPTITHPTETTPDPSSLGYVSLRQNSGSVNITVDGIRVSNDWSLAPLPVELSSFTANLNGRNIELNWITKTEVDNYGFDIERMHQNQPWEKIGFITGNGNSNSPKSYSFIDDKLSGSGTYSYRLKQIDNDGTFEYSTVISVTADAPAEFILNQNFPNPFNPETNISFSLPEPGMVKLSVYNSLGKEVAVLVNRGLEAGYHSIPFNINSISGNYSSGVYFYKLETDGLIQTNKMILLK